MLCPQLFSMNLQTKSQARSSGKLQSAQICRRGAKPLDRVGLVRASSSHWRAFLGLGAAQAEPAGPAAEPGRRKQIELALLAHCFHGLPQERSAQLLAEEFQRPPALLLAAAQQRVDDLEQQIFEKIAVALIGARRDQQLQGPVAGMLDRMQQVRLAGPLVAQDRHHFRVQPRRGPIQLHHALQLVALPGVQLRHVKAGTDVIVRIAGEVVAERIAHPPQDFQRGDSTATVRRERSLAHFLNKKVILCACWRNRQLRDRPAGPGSARESHRAGPSRDADRCVAPDANCAGNHETGRRSGRPRQPGLFCKSRGNGQSPSAPEACQCRKLSSTIALGEQLLTCAAEPLSRSPFVLTGVVTAGLLTWRKCSSALCTVSFSSSRYRWLAWRRQAARQTDPAGFPENGRWLQEWASD